jgi:ribosome-associated protein
MNELSPEIIESPVEPSSKSEKKRQMQAIAELALKIVGLSPSEFNTIGMDLELRAEFDAVRRISSHIARRRQLRHLVAVLSLVDHVKLRSALSVVTGGSLASERKHHSIERLRDKMLTGGNDIIDEVLSKFPNADRQHLRNLQRNIIKEKTDAGVARQKKNLFVYLRSLSAN